MNRDSIIVRSEPLCEDYLPSYIHEREHEIKWLMNAMFPAVRGRKPVNVWVHGKPGTGKTSVCRFVLRKLRERWGEQVKGAYVNCGRYSSLYSILDAIIREFKLLGGDTPSTSNKLNRFLEYVRNKPFILILDEIDFPSPKERNVILYNLSRTGNIGIVCISQAEDTYHRLDQRVKSRLHAKAQAFVEYSKVQINSILLERAKAALKNGSWGEQVLDHIAELSQGDLRIAIETLKSAAEHAESEGVRIDIGHVHRGSKDIKAIQRDHLLKGLTEHHKILYRLIESKTGVLSGDLWDVYLGFCRTSGQNAVARRTFTSYLQGLENVGLITSEKVSVKGKVRSFRVSEQS